MRPANALGDTTGFAELRDTPMVDVVNGGQFGFAIDPATYVSSTPYVRRNLIPIVLELPRGFDYLPNPPKWRAAGKAILELHAKSIEGLNMKLSVEFVEQPFGGSGEIQQSVSNVTRARSEPSFSYVEKYGRPFSIFFDAWIKELLMDPETKVANVVTRAASKGKLLDLLPDVQGATMLFIEPDPTMQKVDKAWLLTNMMPMEGVDTEGRRDLTAASDQLEFNMTFTNIGFVGYGVNILAQKMLNELNLLGKANPNLRPAFLGGVAADVKAAEAGYVEKINAAAKAAVA